MYAFDAVNGWYDIPDIETEFGEAYSLIEARGFGSPVVLSRYDKAPSGVSVYEWSSPMPEHPYQFLVEVSFGRHDYDIVTKDFPSLLELLNKLQGMSTLIATK
jgi:hypothetical protein